MNTKVVKVWTDSDAVYILTEEGYTLKELFADYPRLRVASNEQRINFEYDNIGIHWKELNEDLSYKGFYKTNKFIK